MPTSHSTAAQGAPAFEVIALDEVPKKQTREQISQWKAPYEALVARPGQALKFVARDADDAVRIRTGLGSYAKRAHNTRLGAKRDPQADGTIHIYIWLDQERTNAQNR